MLLKVFTNIGVLAYKDIDKTFFRRRCAGGMKYLQFDVSTRHPLYSYFHLEGQVEYLGDLYVIKGISSRSKAQICTVNCELDLDGLDNKKITKTYTTTSFSTVAGEALAGTGWRIVDADLVSRRTTLELQDNTPREILDKCTNKTAFGTCYEFDTKNKIIKCIKPYNNTTPTGTYFTDELNLDDLSTKGTSSGLFTKLYAYGKDGLTIARANAGVEYIEDYSYTDRVIVKTWRDERYTDPYELFNDAKVMLKAGAVPEISYQLKVIDLAKTKPEIYNESFAYDLYDVTTLIDRDSKVRSDLRIVELCEYPADHTLDTIVISNITGRITGKITTLTNRLSELDAQQLHDRTKVNEIKQDLDTTVLHVSENWGECENKSVITQTSEGLFFDVDKIVGQHQWSTKIRQSATDIMFSWNSYSDYIKFENINSVAQINFYSSQKTSSNQKPILSMDKTGQKIYDTSGTLLMHLGSDGQRFYYKGNTVGLIGTTSYINSDSKRGLVFNLRNSSTYMAWCWDDNTGDGYQIKLAYLKPNVTMGILSGGSEKDSNGTLVGSLHTLCPLDLHKHHLHNAVLKDWAFDGGGFTGSKTFQIPTSIRTNDGTVATWTTITLSFKNGILQSASGW